MLNIVFLRRVSIQSNGLFRLAILMVAGLASAGDWPQWRGSQRDGHAVSEATLQSLDSQLQPTWRRSIGPGFSAPIVFGDRLVYLDEKEGKEVAHLVRIADGSEVWNRPFADSFSDEWGVGPRSTPLADQDCLYVQSCRGVFRCLSTQDGSTIWGTDFEKEFGTVFVGTKVNEGAAVRRGHNGSAVVNGTHIIVPTGSTNGATLVCFDKRNGQVIWKALSDETAYSSPVVATLDGESQLVAFTADALVGLNLKTGATLWRVPVKTAAKRHALSPVILGGDRVFVASHSFGALCVHVTRSGGTWTPKTLWHNTMMRINLSTPTAVGDALYGFGTDTDFVCINAATGANHWAQPGFGKGVTTDYASTIALGDKLLVLNEAGQLQLLHADITRYRTLGQVQVCGKTWCHPAYANGRLYVRDGRSLQCFVLK